MSKPLPNYNYPLMCLVVALKFLRESAYFDYDSAIERIELTDPYYSHRMIDITFKFHDVPPDYRLTFYGLEWGWIKHVITDTGSMDRFRRNAAGSRDQYILEFKICSIRDVSKGLWWSSDECCSVLLPYFLRGQKITKSTLC
jgi:hypothetical protein